MCVVGDELVGGGGCESVPCKKIKVNRFLPCEDFNFFFVIREIAKVGKCVSYKIKST